MQKVLGVECLNLNSPLLVGVKRKSRLRGCGDRHFSLSFIRSRPAFMMRVKEYAKISQIRCPYSGADVARYLGVTNSFVTRMISTGKKQDIDDINLEL